MILFYTASYNTSIYVINSKLSNIIIIIIILFHGIQVKLSCIVCGFLFWDFIFLFF